jgi:alcohol dehydrogenase (cytochrome c)
MRGLVAVLLLLVSVAIAAAQVPYSRLLKPESEPFNWLTYSGNYQGHRFSPLSQITPQNVARLKPAWVYQIEGRVASKARRWLSTGSCT